MSDTRREHTMHRLYEQGREIWPSIDLEEADFAAPDGARDDHAGDLYLARACAAGIAEALCAFEQGVLPQVVAALRKLDPSPAFADEVKQVLRNRLLTSADDATPRIASYGGRGPLATWVCVVAVRVALNLRGKHWRERPLLAKDLADAAPAAADPELEYLKKRYASEFEAAFKHACAALSSRERAVLRLNFSEGLNIEQIGHVYGVHRATVARWIAKARELLLSGTREDLARRLSLSDAEFDSLLRMVRSRIDISISRFFAATEP